MFGSSENSSLSSGEGASGFSGQGDSGVEAQQLVKLLLIQALNQQVHKTCFKKCFPSNKFYSELSKSDHVCLAKCMDRMYEANEIVHQATVEMRQNFPPSGTGL
ncbi:Tim10/DDP family zinc finger superfamily protein [Toxoplasma gondii ME49]|uniref:Mitochondrial import inner membrane translocase subunit n=13 Tax=Toxoplasma gondii TaxID=5811 RepID=B9PN09_TOXGV|nr:Tim10/DDP family zinc finger superfamily protein [Toxoplasma gondii ME49]EPR62373.1 Tim10/DDP family zinc finger superfamily protein [Toxoplasma gondii GT1]ESS32751.1 Tim10/DDP family zinc finger superfamily protein [Toxoplasma gondii VEG]KAF4640792.1 Tim10/DDP family zinc finger superfamily protein [Toxoplasma gondii]KFG42036.1 Tim10/DDP family zinc finger superfamily protein [Toxoplasma gondii p89]KFG45039.1 Tim10/DDP family zinc finger superfamily protein [Toxoplasma gondii GAB2-2007-GAL|eukprot:XP_002366410.1 Tim10/DDP family zinc finger superfamily protein [Toxoplasma gondii ME49]